MNYKMLAEFGGLDITAVMDCCCCVGFHGTLVHAGYPIFVLLSFKGLNPCFMHISLSALVSNFSTDLVFRYCTMNNVIYTDGGNVLAMLLPEHDGVLKTIQITPRSTP